MSIKLEASAAVRTERERLVAKVTLLTWVIGFLVFAVLVAFVSGIVLGVNSGERYGLIKEHCRQAGGTLDEASKCVRVTPVPLPIGE